MAVKASGCMFCNMGVMHELLAILPIHFLYVFRRLVMVTFNTRLLSYISAAPNNLKMTTAARHLCLLKGLVSGRLLRLIVNLLTGRFLSENAFMGISWQIEHFALPSFSFAFLKWQRKHDSLGTSKCLFGSLCIWQEVQ